MNDVVVGSRFVPVKPDARVAVPEAQPQVLSVSLEPVLRRCLAYLESQGDVVALQQDAQRTRSHANLEKMLA